MRNFLLVVLALAAVCYYFDISPTDFLPTLPNSEAAKERNSRSRPAAEQKPAAAPQPTSTASVPSRSDGSLGTRWQSSASPAKP